MNSEDEGFIGVCKSCHNELWEQEWRQQCRKCANCEFCCHCDVSDFHPEVKS